MYARTIPHRAHKACAATVTSPNWVFRKYYKRTRYRKRRKVRCVSVSIQPRGRASHTHTHTHRERDATHDSPNRVCVCVCMCDFPQVAIFYTDHFKLFIVRFGERNRPCSLSVVARFRDKYQTTGGWTVVGRWLADGWTMVGLIISLLCSFVLT